MEEVHGNEVRVVLQSVPLEAEAALVWCHSVPDFPVWIRCTDLDQGMGEENHGTTAPDADVNVRTGMAAAANQPDKREQQQ